MTPEAKPTYWIIWFDDADDDAEPEVFTDEKAARERFAALEDNWCCHIFCQQELLDKERAAHAETRDNFTRHLRCLEAILGQVCQLPAIDDESGLIALIEQLAASAVEQLRQTREQFELEKATVKYLRGEYHEIKSERDFLRSQLDRTRRELNECIEALRISEKVKEVIAANILTRAAGTLNEDKK